MWIESKYNSLHGPRRCHWCWILKVRHNDSAHAQHKRRQNLCENTFTRNRQFIYSILNVLPVWHRRWPENWRN